MIEPYYNHNGIMIFCGHVLDVLRSMENECVNCVVTSPPYWGLRDYGLEPQIWDGEEGCGHKWGAKNFLRKTGNPSGPTAWTGTHKRGIEGIGIHQGQFCLKCNAWCGSLGLEPTPELYIKHIVGIFREVRRVLRKDGTVWLNLGDSYYTGSGACFTPGDGKYSLQSYLEVANAIPKHRAAPNRMMTKEDADRLGLKPKDLCMIPARVALALQADGWWLRQEIVWAKPNCMPESVKDRCTRSHEMIFMLAKSKKYFYDADATREKGRQNNVQVNSRNKRSVWTIATQAFKGAHFATFPEEIPRTCILAGCPEGGTVLDPFMGSGRALIVAKKLRRRAIGIELNREYCEMPLDELAQGVLFSKRS